MNFPVDAKGRSTRCLCLLPDHAPRQSHRLTQLGSGRAYPHGVQVCGVDVDW